MYEVTAKLLLMNFLALICAIVASSGQDKSRTESQTAFVVFAGDANQNPPMLFGGKLLSEMDRIAGITVRRFLYTSPHNIRSAVTVAINNVVFHKSAQVKDLLIAKGKVIKVGSKSITLKVSIERELAGGASELIIDGEFVFVAYDTEAKKAVEHGLTLEADKP